MTHFNAIQDLMTSRAVTLESMATGLHEDDGLVAKPRLSEMKYNIMDKL